MNITTTQARWSVLLMLTATVALATASAAPDQSATVQIDPTSIHHASYSVANDTSSIQAPPQRIAFLAAPATAQPQANVWNNSQSASPEAQTPGVKDSTPDEPGMIILPVITLRSQPTVIQRLGHGISSIIP
jgi:hypothetical protein